MEESKKKKELHVHFTSDIKILNTEKLSQKLSHSNSECLTTFLSVNFDIKFSTAKENHRRKLNEAKSSKFISEETYQQLLNFSQRGEEELGKVAQQVILEKRCII